jgi:HAE1 family hydrophobic/amphiphilic exporter-1
MKIADVSIRRPVFAVMMSAAIVVLGLASYNQLGLDLMPKTDLPMVFVRTSLPGASSEEVESQITKPIEEVVNTIAGIDELRSSSNQGSSQVMIQFVLERDIESAVQDVRDKVATIANQFPLDTLPPVIQKMDPDSSPILTIAVSGNRSQKEISQIVDKDIKQVLETVPNVGEVTFTGDRPREIHLLLNEDRMNAYGLTVDQVRSAVQRQNVEIPGGSFLAGPAEIALRTMGRIQNVDDFNRIIIAYQGGSVITFKDIGRVLDTVQEPTSVARLDGNEAVSLMIRKQSGTNTVKVVDDVMARLERIKRNLPPDIKIHTTRDQSTFIRKSFTEIQHHRI